MTRLLLPLAILAPLVLLIAAAAFFGALEAPESEDAPFVGTTLRWRNGTVGTADYSAHPGRYANRVEWEGAGGERRVLVELGDFIPRLEVTEDDELVVRWMVPGDGGDWRTEERTLQRLP